jgi:hypothetical protein
MAEAAHSGSCHCGAVQLRVPSAPAHLTNCNCSICWRYGALWAYFMAASVTILRAPDAVEEYCWGLKELRFFRCRHCGVVTHWEKAEPSAVSVVGINMRNFDLAALARAQIVAVNGLATRKNHFDA